MLLAVQLTGNSFNWTDVPFPLSYFQTGQYQLVVWPRDWDVATQGTPPIIAQSDLFTIAPTAGEGPPSTTTPQVGANSVAVRDADC
jgi:hypothetical protein